MLFFASFGSGLQPLMIDADDLTHATKIATDVAEGEAPARVKPIPTGVVVVSLFTEPEDEDEDVIVMDPLDHVVTFLERLDEELMGDARPTCGHEAEAGDANETVTCTLPPHTDGRHEGLTEDGELVTWAD